MLLALRILVGLLMLQALVKFAVFFVVPDHTRRKMLDTQYGAKTSATKGPDLLLLAIVLGLILLFGSGRVEYPELRGRTAGRNDVDPDLFPRVLEAAGPGGIAEPGRHFTDQNDVLRDPGGSGQTVEAVGDHRRPGRLVLDRAVVE